MNTERVPPGHPIILLPSNKFNMAAVSVKRSISMFSFYVLARSKKEREVNCTIIFSGILTGTAIETVTETGEWVTFHLTLQLPKVLKKSNVPTFANSSLYDL